jgi:H+-transporting ATPase
MNFTNNEAKKKVRQLGTGSRQSATFKKEDANAAPKAQTKIGPEITAKPEAVAEVKVGSNSDTKTADTTPIGKDESRPEAKGKVPTEVTPQLVKRVHALYEELGREEVQAVQEWEKSEPETLKK